MVRFGTQVDIQGVLGDTEQAGQCLRYLVKYLTKSLDECHEPDSSSAIAHVDRLADALRFGPCSPTCANWLLYGVAPHNAKLASCPGCARARPTSARTSATAAAAASSPANGPGGCRRGRRSSVVVSSAPKIAAIALRQVCESRSISARTRHSLLEDHRVGFGFLDPVFQG